MTTTSISHPRRTRRGASPRRRPASAGRGALLAAAALAAAAAGGCARGEGASAGPVSTVATSGASNPTVARGTAGDAFVAWVGAGPGGQDVYLSRRAVGGGAWSAPVRVNDLAGDAAAHEQAPAQVAVGPDGTIYVAWQNNTKVPGRRFPASDLRLARSTDGGRTFEPAITVNDDAGGPPASHTFHNVAVAGDGTVYVSWLDSRVRDAAAERGSGRAGDAAGDERGSGRAGDAAKSAGVSASGAAASSGAIPHSPTPPLAPSAAPAGPGMGSGMHHHGASDPDDPGSDIRFAASTDGGRSFSASRVVDRNACP
ncbi:MAG TPA: sialidase family protein, partial [Longimicrobiales bacterium]|nr:sialidase family protein [Longimicrobiales bacterium]